MGNNNTNVTTTKGIARSLTNSTSPQSDSENRPIQVPSSIMNGAPKPGHAVSPAAGNQFKQSTIAFNNANKKSPAAAHGGVKMVGKDKKSFLDIASSSSSDSSTCSSDEEVLESVKNDPPLKPAKVI